MAPQSSDSTGTGSASSSFKVTALAAQDKSGVMRKMEIERREPGPEDVKIKIKFCGICHSDLHQIKNEWGGAEYPMVPGHEIVGVVEAVGASVTKFKQGDKVGVGCFVDSCRSCRNCRTGDEQYCTGDDNRGIARVETYNTKLPDGGMTYGGYSQYVVVDHSYVLRVPDNLDMAQAAPLLCPGITVYSPFKHYGVQPHHTVGVVGFGGLGHVAVKILRAMGCRVVVFSRSPDKAQHARALGATDVVITTEKKDVEQWQACIDLILDTVSAPHSIEDYLGFLRTNGRYMIVGMPTEPFSFKAQEINMNRISIGGSLIGSITETQEMLDFCGQHNITADIELIKAGYINKAMQRLQKNDVRYRFVIDVEGSLTPDVTVDDA